MKKIKIKYIDKEMPKLTTTDKGDWIDLRASESVDLKKGEYKLLKLGVAMELPKGYEAIVAPRSSTYKNFGIAIVNSIGIIDNSYCGDNDEWRCPAYALRDTHIEKHDRICQFRIIKNQPEINFIEVDKLENEDRNGIGSSGVK